MDMKCTGRSVIYNANKFSTFRKQNHVGFRWRQFDYINMLLYFTRTYVCDIFTKTYPATFHQAIKAKNKPVYIYLSLLNEERSFLPPLEIKHWNWLQ